LLVGVQAVLSDGLGSIFAFARVPMEVVGAVGLRCRGHGRRLPPSRPLSLVSITLFAGTGAVGWVKELSTCPHHSAHVSSRKVLGANGPAIRMHMTLWHCQTHFRFTWSGRSNTVERPMQCGWLASLPPSARTKSGRLDTLHTSRGSIDQGTPWHAERMGSCASRQKLDLGASASVAKFTVSLAQGAVHDTEVDVADPVFGRSTIQSL